MRPSQPGKYFIQYYSIKKSKSKLHFVTPEPDHLYMNVNRQNREALVVSDIPSSSNHVRMPSESSILDEPIDVPEAYTGTKKRLFHIICFLKIFI